MEIDLEIRHPVETRLAVTADRPVDRPLLDRVGAVDHEGLAGGGGSMAGEGHPGGGEHEQEGDPAAVGGWRCP
jgi:hypothetical protein